MPKEVEREIVRSDAETIGTAYGAYVSAVGEVAHAWNLLLGNLGRLFVIVSGIDPSTATAIWYAPDSDRTQLAMLKAALTASPHNRWPPACPKPKRT
jgi:hypothetical protein